MREVLKSGFFALLLLVSAAYSADEYVDIITIADWSIYKDTLGSEGTATVDSTASTVVFDLSKVVKTDSTSPYVNSNGWLDSVLTGVTKIEVTYSSDKEFNFSLPMATTGDGSAHCVKLPIATDTTLTFNIDEFLQPTWVKVEDKKELKLDSVQNLAYELTYVDEKAITGKVTFKAIKLYGYSFDGTVIDPVIVDTPDDISGVTNPVTVIKKISWYDVKDAKGSSVTISTDDNNGTVTSKITQVDNSGGDTYASLGGVLDSTFSGVQAISITYKCDSAVRFALPMKETSSKGVTHAITLPASADFKTFGKKIDGFKQPTWTKAADTITLNLDSVNSIDFSIASNVLSEKIADLVISEIVLYAYKDTIIIPDTVETDTSDVLDDTTNAVAALLKASWYSVKDSLGSAVDFTVAEQSGKVDCTIKKAAKSADKYSYASLSGYFDSTLSGVTAVSLTYTSDKPITVSLGMDETSSSGAAHSITLPASATETVFNKKIDGFTQPEWTKKEDSVKLDLAKVQNLNFEVATLDSAEITGTFSISALTLYNFLDTSVIDTNSYDTTLVESEGLDSKRTLVWDAYLDTLGSTLDTVETDEAITFKVKRAAAVGESGPYVSIVGFNGYFLEELAAVYMKYSATKDFRFSLIMEETGTQGTTHGFMLPKTEGRAENIIMKTVGAFKQPGWVKDADKTLLKVEDIDRVQLELYDDDTKTEKSGEITLSSLRYYGVVGVNALTAMHQNIKEHFTIQRNSMNLTVPVGGKYSVKVYSLNGQVLKAFDCNLKSGFNSVSWNNASLGEQILLLKIEGTKFKAVEKLMVK